MSRDRPGNIFVVSLRRLVVSVDSRAHLATGCSVLEWSTLWSVAVLFSDEYCASRE